MTEAFVPVAIGVAVVTFLTRIGGWLMVSRLKTMPPRVAAALEAVPAAVMTTLFAPQVVSGTWREAAAFAIVVLLAWRGNGTVAVLVATASLVLFRSF